VIESLVENAAMPNMSLSRIRSAAIDGRARNIYYKQGQLEKLHRALVQNAKPIQEISAKDAAYSTAEAKLEFIQTIRALRKHYSSLDPDKELEAEYAIARNQDAADNREPMGIVVIEPSAHSFLFSIVAPLSAAIATGNCVIIQVDFKEPI
jgi:acyl-CoA reductase-like NAD-dependent aldehyde dehydrogenase